MDNHFRSVLIEGDFGRGGLFHGSLTEGEFWARPGLESLVLYLAGNSVDFDPWRPVHAQAHDWTVYESLQLTLTFDATNFDTGDYAVLYSNGGTGSIDLTGDAHDGTRIDLASPWSAGEIDVALTITSPGDWSFAFLTYDAAGNVTAGTPGEASATLWLTPFAPAIDVQSYHFPNIGDPVYRVMLTVDGADVEVLNINLTPASGTSQWFFAARSVGGDGFASAMSTPASILVASSGLDTPSPGGIPGDQTATPAAGGTVTIAWSYFDDIEPTGFKVYRKIGASLALFATRPYSGQGQYAWTSASWGHAMETEWIVRSYTTVSGSDIETQNADTITVTSDAEGPAAITAITLTLA